MKQWEKDDFAFCPVCKRKGWYVERIGQLHQEIHCCRHCGAREYQVVNERGIIRVEVKGK